MKRYLKISCIAILCTFFLMSCKLNKEPVPAEEDSPLSYFPDTIEEYDDGLYRVHVIERNEDDSYQTFFWQTDCQGLYRRSEQTVFDQQNQQIGTKPAESRLQTIREGTGYDALEEIVCNRVRRTMSEVKVMDIDTAMKLAYGNFDAAKNRSRIQNICISGEAFFNTCRVFSDGFVIPVSFLETRDNDLEQFILLVRVDSKNGNFPAYLSARQLVKNNGRWQYFTLLPYLPIDVSDDNKRLEIITLDLGDKKQGMLITSEKETADQRQTKADILAVNDKNALAVVFSQVLSADNEGQCQDLDGSVCWRFDTTITMDESGSARWRDIILSQSGNYLKDGQVVDIPERTRWMMGMEGVYIAH